MRSYRHETTTDDGTGQCMRRRNGKASQRGHDHGETGADRDREQKVFGADELIWNDAFAAEFLEQCLGEKDRHDRTGEGRDRCPRNRGAIIARSTAEKRSDALEVIVRAVGVREKTSGEEQKNERDHLAKALEVSNNRRHHNICCSLPWSRRNLGLWF